MIPTTLTPEFGNSKGKRKILTMMGFVLKVKPALFFVTPKAWQSPLCKGEEMDS